MTAAADVLVDMPVADEDHDETAALLLFERLRATVLEIPPQDEPLALCFCVLVSRINPFLRTSQIADALPGRGHRFGMLELINAMVSLGYRYNAIDIRPCDLDPRLSPAIIVEAGFGASVHPVAPGVIWSWQRKGQTRMRCFDGSTCSVSDGAHLSRSVTALMFRPIDRDRLPTSIKRRRASGYGWFRTTLARFGKEMRRILLLSGAINMLTLAVPLFIMMIYERTLGPRLNDPLVHLAQGAALVVGAEVALRAVRSNILCWLAARLDFLVGVAIFERLMFLPANLVQRASVSDQIARIKTFEAVRDIFCGPILLMTLEMPAALMSLVVLYLLCGPLVVVPVLGILALLLTFWLFWRRIRVRIREAAIDSSVMQQFAIETFEKLDAIRLDGLSRQWSETYRDISGQEISRQARLARLGEMGAGLSQLVVGLTALAALYVGANVIWAGAMQTGTLIAAILLVSRALMPFNALCAMIPRIEQLRNAVAQIDDLMDAPEEGGISDPSRPRSRLQGHLEFAGVALRYDAAAGPVFTGLSFEVRPGEIVAIAGSNGSGKSSVLKLVLATEPALLGHVRIDGFDIRQINVRELREQIAYVPQQIDLFEGTIAENLRLAMPVADDDALRAVLERVGAWDGIAGRDGQLHAALTASDRNDPVFAHRIGLARALLKPSRILLVDEMPAAALSAGFDMTLMDCLRAAARDRAVLVVSHRADFLRLADRAVALRRGQVPVVGSPDKVLEMTA
ncbi:ATP-binding cassette subfamily B protein/ATP-binding cassette subfamily C protein LapB [Palleronia aestuarii]|uniref:ATP-binding cassette subfamily B protein/ATP-binding cassette subfamily C protein LapB n=1 Tax=Palleronia aestuarii TaxID=568105 RepID=A0A2W7NKS1_9RHOB|nr:ATP-binding cassette domain-containing protein [Palleronia aestuarii]PZX11892.1 ATP-binding cassette subfamily B protein/ATP-binding cassette subfamily C protein LapB [Palleronia aestuarii]